MNVMVQGRLNDVGEGCRRYSVRRLVLRGSMDTNAIIDIGGDEMSQLIVRNVGQETVGALKRRAARHGRSAEAEHREILRAALVEDMERASFKAALGSMPDVGADSDFEFARDLPRLSL